MPSKHAVGAEALVAPLYFIAFLLVGTAVLDFALSVIPLRTGDIQWRFATVGLLSGFLLTPLLGIVLAMGIAQWARHTRVQRLLAILNLSGAALFVMLFFAFLLDTVQLRGSVQPEAMGAFWAAATKAMIKHATFIVALGWLSWTGFRLSRVPATPAMSTPAVVIG